LYVVSTALASLLDAVVVGDTTAKGRLFYRWFAPLGSPYNASLLFAAAYLAVMFVVLLPLYRRRIFLRV
jgi:predicted acyltransferase